MKYNCVVPGCSGVIEGQSPTIPCPECSKRVTLVQRLQEQVRDLHSQVLKTTLSRIGRSLGVLRAIAASQKKGGVTARALQVAKTKGAANAAVTLGALEHRGLIVVAGYERTPGRGVAYPIWQLSSLGERVLAEAGDATNGTKKNGTKG